MKYATTHFERNSRHQAWARKRLGEIGFHDTIVEALQNNPLAATDVLREHLRPVADLAFEQAVKTPQYAEIHTFVDWIAHQAHENGAPWSVESEVLTQAIVAWHTARYDHFGRQTYVPTQALSRLLLATELRGLKCSDMVLPYPSIHIAVDPALGFTVHNEQTGAHPLYSLYLTVDSMRGKRGWRILLCGDRSAKSTTEWDDALSHFYLDLSDDDKPILDAVNETFQMVREKGPDWCRRAGMKESDLEEILESWTAAFRWAMNLLFYVTRPDFTDMEHVEANEEAAALWRRMQNAPKGSKKRERILDQYRAAPKRPRILVGRRVVVDDRLPKTYQEAGQALRVRTLVPAHWQRYHRGVGRTEVTWKQKAPYWRGPDEVDPPQEQVHEVR